MWCLVADELGGIHLEPSSSTAPAVGISSYIVLIDRDTYEVPSQDGTRVYEVVYGGDEESCTCPDHAHRGVSCVHLLAVAVKRAKRRGDTARRLRVLEDRLAHEDLPEDERCGLRDRVLRARRTIGRAL